MAQNDYIKRLLDEVHAKFGTDPLPADLIVRFSLTAGMCGQDLKYEQLYMYPGLQEALAFIVHYTPSKWLLEQEASAIRERRLLHHPQQDIPVFEPRAATAAPSQFDPGDIYQWARNNKVAGICFSGGGIRSATFNLGILQGLAKRGWLNGFDYLSSVSGGGYIHSWLAAWLKRRTMEETSKHPDGANYNEDLLTAWNHVAYRLTPLPGRENGTRYQTVWPRQIQWLRRYSNYLTPHVGLLTSDTWSAVAVWIRNVSLNQTLLISIFCGILCFPHLLAPSVRLTPVSTPASLPSGRSFLSLFTAYWRGDWTLPGIFTVLSHAQSIGAETWAALGCFLAGTLLIALLLRREYDFALKATDNAKRLSDYVPLLRRYQVLFANFMLYLLLAFGILLARITLNRLPNDAYPVGLFLLLLLLVWTETFAGGALFQVMKARYQEREERKKNPTRFAGIVSACQALRLAVLAIPAALFGTVGAVAVAALERSSILLNVAAWLHLSNPRSLQIVLSTLLFFWLAPITMIVASGFIGKDFPDWLGEWLGRIRGYSLLMGISWIFLCGSALLMPAILVLPYTWGWLKWPAVAGWLGTTAASVLGGKSSRTSGDQATGGGGGSKALEAVILIGPYVYIAGLVFVLSLVLEKLHGPLVDAFFAGNDSRFWLTAIAALLVIVGLLGWRLDINEFSMHTFYRDRLTRCYLGASNLTRSPSPVTGFDQHDTDNLKIAELTLHRSYPGPIPLFCCTMNITLGEDLAWQERKAASFAFTPFYSGYTVGWTEGRKNLRFNGFVPTEFLYQGGPDIATAMAASGAAVSPNWGYHTNPALAFLMTMFDVRLGLWVPNPRCSELAGQKLGASPGESIPPSPRFAPKWLSSELLGGVNDTAKYVYLTDGGHFDNMGLYELVRRRCYKIVICDAEEDGRYTYEGIGGAIRKCRIDFGVEIHLDFSTLTPNTNSKLSPAHIAQGTIRYPETPVGAEGTVLYIKSSLTGFVPRPQGDGDVPAAPVPGSVELPNVPGDVQSYKLEHEDFPHDSTAEQWFTESQFESYRRLGQRVVASID